MDTFQDLSTLTVEALEQTLTLLEAMKNPREGNHLQDWAHRLARFTALQTHRENNDPVMIRVYLMHQRMIHLLHKFPA